MLSTVPTPSSFIINTFDWEGTNCKQEYQYLSLYCKSQRIFPRMEKKDNILKAQGYNFNKFLCLGSVGQSKMLVSLYLRLLH